MKYIYCVRSVLADVHIDLVLVGYIDVDIAVLTIFTLLLRGPEKTDFILLSQLSCRGRKSTTGRLFTEFFRQCLTWSRSLR